MSEPISVVKSPVCSQPDNFVIDKAQTFKSDERSVVGYPILIDFKKVIKLSASDCIVGGITNNDLLHAVVALYQTSLSSMTPDTLYEHVCDDLARTIVIMQDPKDCTEQMSKRTEIQQHRRRREQESAKQDDFNDTEDESGNYTKKDDSLEENSKAQPYCPTTEPCARDRNMNECSEPVMAEGKLTYKNAIFEAIDLISKADANNMMCKGEDPEHHVSNQHTVQVHDSNSPRSKEIGEHNINTDIHREEVCDKILKKNKPLVERVTIQADEPDGMNASLKQHGTYVEKQNGEPVQDDSNKNDGEAKRDEGSDSSDLSDQQESSESDYDSENDVYEEPDSDVSVFDDVYSDTESESDEDESDSEDGDSDGESDTDYSRGIGRFVSMVNLRRQARLADKSDNCTPHLGIENMLLGCLTFERKYVKTSKILHITLVAVRKRYQLLGIGRYLMKKLFEREVIKDIDAIIVHADNLAVDFFKKFSFTDDFIMNSRWIQFADQFTNCTMMCYLPSFTAFELVEQRKHEQLSLAQIHLNDQITKWQKKSLEAYQAQLSCMFRYKQELARLVESDGDEVKNATVQNETSPIDMRDRGDTCKENGFPKQVVAPPTEHVKSLVAGHPSIIRENDCEYDHVAKITPTAPMPQFGDIVMFPIQAGVTFAKSVFGLLTWMFFFKWMMSIVKVYKGSKAHDTKDYSNEKLNLYFSPSPNSKFTTVLRNGFSDFDMVNTKYGRCLCFTPYPKPFNNNGMNKNETREVVEVLLAEVNLGRCIIVQHDPDPDAKIRLTFRNDGQRADSAVLKNKEGEIIEYLIYTPCRANPLYRTSYSIASPAP